MKSINKLMLEITKIVEIALEECCLPMSQIFYDSISSHFVVHILSQFTCKNGKTKKIEIEAKVKSDAKRWNKKIEIWTTSDSGMIEMKATRLTKLIDDLSAIKKKVLSC